jgi:hypothetical protein
MRRHSKLLLLVAFLSALALISGSLVIGAQNPPGRATAPGVTQAQNAAQYVGSKACESCHRINISDGRRRAWRMS